MKLFADPLMRMILGGTKRDASLLLHSGLFDLGFYASQVYDHEKPSISHFLKQGWRRGLSPSPFFDSVFYLLANPDVKKAGWNPAMHYIRHGWREGRTPHPRFDIAGYIAGHPHVDFQSIDPLQHCIEHYRSLEWGGGASGTMAAGTIDYRALVAEQRQVEALFDREYYNSMYEDIREPGIDPFLHYTRHGWRENRNPSPEFDTWYFLKNHPEFAVSQKLAVASIRARRDAHALEIALARFASTHDGLPLYTPGSRHGHALPGAACRSRERRGRDFGLPNRASPKSAIPSISS